MASTDARDRPFFDQHEYEDDDDDDDDDFDDEEFTDEGFEPLNPNPNAVSFASPVLPENGTLLPAPISINERKFAPFDDSRRLFQRLWTDEDEIVILEGFLDFVTRRGTTHNNYQHDTGPFYEQIKNKIQLDFNKNQLIEKIRRLKKKYRTVDSRMKAMAQAFTFKSAHEKATYEISKQIWSSTFKRPRNRCYNPEKNDLDAASNGAFDEIRVQQMTMGAEDPNLDAPVAAAAQAQTYAVSVSSVVEETVKCCLLPLFKELLQHGICGPSGGLLLNSLPLSVSNGLGNLPKGLDGNKWKEQQILELEVYLKRVELLEEQIKATLEELRSSSSSATMKTES